jgi:hypothetical protein
VLEHRLPVDRLRSLHCHRLTNRASAAGRPPTCRARPFQAVHQASVER